MTEEDNLQKTVIAELRSLRNDMERIAGFIVEMRRDYSVLEDKMELSSSDVIRLLGISRASLARWRAPTQSRSGIYHATTLLIRSRDFTSPSRADVPPSRVQTSGSPTTLNAYKDGVLKGYMGDGQTLFEEL